MSNKSKVRSKVLLSLIFVAAMVAVVFFWFFYHRTPKNSTIPSSSPNSKTSNGSSSNDVGLGTDENAQATKSSQSAGQSSILIAPFGQFVSNHMPGRNGSNLKEQSVCNTSPDAICYIKFTQGYITKQLDAKKANSDGSVIWSWDVGQAGLGKGKWKITAVSSHNGQTKATDDNIELEIQ